ncbi:hypothetical protein KI387_012471, partial [Taxus chinensis]
LFLKVNASGVQIYRCDESSNGSGMMEYNHIGANSNLFSVYDNEKNISLGYHYYLSHPLAQGARLTFSFSTVDGDTLSAIPESTVTGNKFGTAKGSSVDDIDDLLLKAVCLWDRSLNPADIPAEIRIDSENFSHVSGFYSEEQQHYRFNGSSWINFNATSFLYTSPGKEVVGRHYFLEEADDNGGQPSWDLFMPAGLSKVRVTTKVVSTVTVEKDSVDWSKLEATSYGGSPHDISRSYLGQVKYVQRVSTVAGLPPTEKDFANPEAGNIYLSPFSKIYWFYSTSL